MFNMSRSASHEILTWWYFLLQEHNKKYVSTVFFFFFKKYVTFIKKKRNSIYLELMRLYHVKIFLYPSYKINNILYILSQYIY